VFCALLLAFAPAFAQPLSPAAWQEDLDFLARELPAHHKNLFYRLTREQFQKEVADIREKIPTWSEPPDPRGPPAIARIRGQCPHHDQRNRRGAVLPHPLRALSRWTLRGSRHSGQSRCSGRTVIKRLLPLVPMETPLMPKLHLPVLTRNAWALGAEHFAGRDPVLERALR